MNDLICAIVNNVENLVPSFDLKTICEYTYGHTNVPKEELMQIQMQQDYIVKYTKELANKLYSNNLSVSGKEM